MRALTTKTAVILAGMALVAGAATAGATTTAAGATGPVSARQAGTPTWGAPDADVPPSPLHLDSVMFADLGEAAAFSGNVVLGTFERRVATSSALELFPDDEMSVQDPLTARTRHVEVWSLRVEDVLAGPLRAGEEVLVLNEQMETDVPGVVEDPERVQGQRVVALLDGTPRRTSLGTAWFTVNPAQLGSGFALVADDGTVLPDPESHLLLPAVQQVREAAGRSAPTAGTQGAGAQGAGARVAEALGLSG